MRAKTGKSLRGAVFGAAMGSTIALSPLLTVNAVRTGSCQFDKRRHQDANHCRTRCSAALALLVKLLMKWARNPYCQLKSALSVAGRGILSHGVY
jgi:hypothetical protein